jgi:hypothetical protein
MEEILGVLLVGAIGALAAGAWAIAGRIRRAERALLDLRRLGEIGDRVHTIGEVVSRLDLSRLEGPLRELVEAAPRIERALWKVEEAAARPAASAGAEDGEGVVRTIEVRLRQLGYERVRVLEVEAPSPEGPEECAFPVEAVRGEVAHKGKVVVRRGVVAEVQLRPAHGFFP